MLAENSGKKGNPCLLATVTALCSALGFAIAKYLLGSQPELLDLLVFAVVFGIIFFTIQKLLQKREGGK